MLIIYFVHDQFGSGPNFDWGEILERANIRGDVIFSSLGFKCWALLINPYGIRLEKYGPQRIQNSRLLEVL